MDSVTVTLLILGGIAGVLLLTPGGRTFLKGWAQDYLKILVVIGAVILVIGLFNMMTDTPGEGFSLRGRR